ncbi:uncharacterized protein LOC129592900 [Paramacrobiotus metropolitanus]|uniref:uncharacterized protein LOC129592900 n=1 Tax=Paramacrobiotus metropolitanus TaxID=2943436 RepID=UPI00244632F5|nr:uncharacterized protein LOC129592900 [Paramacrobiotus metropolitanus]
MSATAVEMQTSPVTFPLSIGHRLDTIRTAAEMKWSSNWSTPARPEGRKVTAGQRDRIPKVLLSIERKPKPSVPKDTERKHPVNEVQQTPEKVTAAKDPQAEEKAWGPLFKSREHFTEMHLC